MIFTINLEVRLIPDRRSSILGMPTTGPMLKPQMSHRSFPEPGFVNAAALWKPPVTQLKSRASLLPTPMSCSQTRPKFALPHLPNQRIMCPDVPVVREPLALRQQPGPTSSMQQAWSKAKLDLTHQWLALLTEMGTASGLVRATAQSKHVEDHRSRVIAKFAPSTLQSYFRIWRRWHDFASNLGASPFNPATVLLADFLAEHAHGPLQVATAYFKGLSWMSRQAQLPDLFQALQSMVCKAYLQSSTISEKRESAPLPLSFVLYLEKTVLAKTTTPGDVLQLGSLLFMIWSSLRWSDTLWIRPDSITIQQHAVFALSSHTKTTNRGMPVACFAFGMLGQHGSASWAQVWLNVVHQALYDTTATHPGFDVDYLLTEIGSDAQKPQFLKPLPRDRGLQLLRYWLCQCHEAHQVEAKLEDFHLLGTHSCKTTMLCWAQQLQLPLEQRQLQGHHRWICGSLQSQRHSASFDVAVHNCPEGS